MSEVTSSRTNLAAAADGALFEIVDGQIVEKEPMGTFEVLLASFLNTCLDGFARSHNLGRAVAEMLFDLGENLPQRRPDVAFVSYERWPRRRPVRRANAWAVVPELSVEVVSRTNAFDDVVSKVHEYFQAGVQCVWVVLPTERQVYVYQSPSQIRVLNRGDVLEGEPFLPGFRLDLADLFEQEVVDE